MVHAVDPAPLRAFLPGEKDVRGHALGQLTGLRELPIPGAADALAWAEENLPTEEPCVLLHGDLLGQNLLLSPDEPLGVIDWGMARLGDPAYDLAIVTRGARRPFQAEHGLERLLEAYERRSGRTLTPSRVHLHELVLCAGFYEQEVECTAPGAQRRSRPVRSCGASWIGRSRGAELNAAGSAAPRRPTSAASRSRTSGATTAAAR